MLKCELCSKTFESGDKCPKCYNTMKNFIRPVEPKPQGYQIIHKYAKAAYSVKGCDTWSFEGVLDTINNFVNVPRDWYVERPDGEKLNASVFANLVNNQKLNEDAVFEYFS